MMKENKNKPNLYNSKEKPPCPFCKERYENMKVDGQGILEHESEKFFWVNNKFPVIADLHMTMMLLLDECNEGIPDYSIDRIQKLIDYSLWCEKEMKQIYGYKHVVIMQNYGYLSGGSVPHPHFQINGIRNPEIVPKNDLIHYENGHLIEESEDKNSRLSFTSNPLSEKYELDISWKGDKMTEEAALYLKQATDYTRHFKEKTYKHYNLLFNYDEVNDIHYIKVIYREPVSAYLFLDLHMTIDPTEFIENFKNHYK